MTEYYHKGSIQRKYQIDNNNNDGFYIEYFTNGHVSQRGHFKFTSGFLVKGDSAQTFKRIQKMDAKKSVYVGQWFSYYANGNLKSIRNYANYYYCSSDTSFSYPEDNHGVVMPGINIETSVFPVLNGLSVYYDSISNNIVKQESWLNGKKIGSE